MKKRLGILGGMGPLATADLYRKIVEFYDGKNTERVVKMLEQDNII